MPAISLQQAQDQLALYLAAEKAVLGSQHYEIAGRKLTRANLAEIRQGIVEWEARVERALRSASGRSRRRTVMLGG